MPLLLLNKPFHVLSQFTTDGDKRTLADYIHRTGVYAAGRLDYDSEGLLLLTDDGRLQSRIAHPRHKLAKTYFAQVEGLAGDEHCRRLEKGVTLKDGPAQALRAAVTEAPAWLWPRQPPIRVRKTVPDSWIRLSINEGRNRQVRRMTAAVGLPTLRLIRSEVGPFRLDGLAPGEYRELPTEEAWSLLKRR